jgi:glycerol kinase
VNVLVIDAGTSGVRAALVSPDATVTAERHRPVLPDTPAPGLVEFDAAALAAAAMEVATDVLAGTRTTPVAVGVANQRASAVAWDRTTGVPLGPGLGWQDLRTVGTCLELGATGLRLAPNQTATKAAWLADTHDPGRTRDVCVGTIDSWLAWVLTRGERFITDATNAGVTGLATPDGTAWDPGVLDALRLDAHLLPTIVDSAGDLGVASALPGAPPLVALVGDQQASMVGQGVVFAGPAKVTLGTGGMLDVVTGPDAPASAHPGAAGTFPIVAWRHTGANHWGREAIMLSAGTNVEWLCDDLGIIDDVADTDAVAASCDDTGGVVYVPALLGLGTPQWDYGARGTLVGLTRGTGVPEVVRAVLEGVAHCTADLAEATETDTGTAIGSLRLDGGMSRNATLTQALANATQRVVEVSPVVEATALGAGLLAGVACGWWSTPGDLAATWAPRDIVEPTGTLDRDRWREACERAGGWLPDLSAVSF